MGAPWRRSLRSSARTRKQLLIVAVASFVTTWLVGGKPKCDGTDGEERKHKRKHKLKHKR